MKDIQFTFDNLPIVVGPKEIEEWAFTGLNNVDFVEEVLLQRKGA